MSEEKNGSTPREFQRQLNEALHEDPNDQPQMKNKRKIFDESASSAMNDVLSENPNEYPPQKKNKRKTFDDEPISSTLMNKFKVLKLNHQTKLNEDIDTHKEYSLDQSALKEENMTSKNNSELVEEIKFLKTLIGNLEKRESHYIVIIDEMKKDMKILQREFNQIKNNSNNSSYDEDFYYSSGLTKSTGTKQSNILTDNQGSTKKTYIFNSKILTNRESREDSEERDFWYVS